MKQTDEYRASNRATVIVSGCEGQIILRQALYDQLKMEGFIPNDVSISDITFGRIVTVAKLRRVNADGTQFDRGLNQKNNPDNDGNYYTFASLVVTKQTPKAAKPINKGGTQKTKPRKPDSKDEKNSQIKKESGGIAVEVTNGEAVSIGNSRFKGVKKVILYFAVFLIVFGLSGISILALKSMGS